MTYPQNKNDGGVHNVVKSLKKKMKEDKRTQGSIALHMGWQPQRMSSVLNKSDMYLSDYMAICEALSIDPFDLLKKVYNGEDASVVNETEGNYGAAEGLIQSIADEVIKRLGSKNI